MAPTLKHLPNIVRACSNGCRQPGPLCRRVKKIAGVTLNGSIALSTNWWVPTEGLCGFWLEFAFCNLKYGKFKFRPAIMYYYLIVKDESMDVHDNMRELE